MGKDKDKPKAKKAKAEVGVRRVYERCVIGLSSHHRDCLKQLAKKDDTKMTTKHHELLEKALVRAGCKPSPEGSKAKAVGEKKTGAKIGKKAEKKAKASKPASKPSPAPKKKVEAKKAKASKPKTTTKPAPVDDDEPPF